MTDLVKKDGKVEVLGQVVVPKKFYDRIKLGVQILDEIFGGVDMPGIMPGSSLLFTGMPGAGKSTMALQLAELLSENSGRSVLYNIGEESKEMMKLCADRLNIKANFCIAQITYTDDLLNYVEKNGVEFLFVDSLQSMKDKDQFGHDLWGPKLLKSVTKKLHRFAKDHDVNVIIVGHITKGGGFAGPQEIKHDVDAHAHLKLNTDSGNRIFEMQKNRFGPAMMPYEFALSAHGLDFSAAKPEDTKDPEDGGGSKKASQRRTDIVKLIKEKILAGEPISGYCFERLNVDCSGGFWRGMLALAVKALKAEGHKVGEKRINGRLHSFLVNDRDDEENAPLALDVKA